MTWRNTVKTARGSLSQADAARAIWSSLPVSTLQDWELGRREPPDWVQGLVLQRLRAALRRRSPQTFTKGRRS